MKFSILRKNLFSPEDDTNKEIYAIVGEMVVTASKALLAEIQDEKQPRRSICRVLGVDSVGIIYPMLTMLPVCSKWQSIIPLKYLLEQ